MIYYSVDTEPRRMRVFLLAVIAVVSSAILSPILIAVDPRIGGVSTAAVFAALYWVFDRHLWKRLPFFVSGIPNLNGEWNGNIERGIKPGEMHGKTGTIKVTITQTWSRVDIIFKGTHSVAKAEIVGLSVENPHHIELRYGYAKVPQSSGSVNRPDSGYSTGYTVLELSRSGGQWILRGRYFSDQHRGGELELVRIDSNRQP